MVAKIRLEAEDATKEAFDSAAKGAEKVDKALKDVTSTMKKTEDATDDVFHSIEELKFNLDEADAKLILLKSGFKENEVAAMGLQEQLANARHELDTFANSSGKVDTELSQSDVTLMRMRSTVRGMTADLEQLEHQEKEVAAAAHQMNAANNGMNAANAGSTKFLETMTKIWAFKETFMKLAQGVMYLDTQGNPAAERLVESFTKLRETLVKLAETEQFQYSLDGIAGSVGAVDDALSGLTGSTSEAESGFSTLLRLAQEWTNWSVNSYLEWNFYIKKGSTEESNRMAEERRERIKNHEEIMEQKKQQAAAKKQLADLEKVNVDIEKQRAIEEYQEQIAKVKGLAEIEAMLKQQKETSWKLAEQGDQEADKAEVNAKKILALEVRRKAILKEEEDYRKENLRKSKEIEEQMRKEDLELFMEAQEKKRQFEEQLAQGRYDAQQKELQQARDHMQKLADIAKGEMDKGNAPGLDLETMGGGVASSKRVTKEYTEKKIAQAEDEMRKQFFGDKKINKDGQVIDEAAMQQYRDDVNKVHYKSMEDLDGVFDENANFTSKEKKAEYDKYMQEKMGELHRTKYKDAEFSSEGEIINEGFTEQYQAKRNRTVRQARKDAEKEIRSGAADDDLYRMQQDFAQGYIEQEGANRGFSRKTVEALKQAAVASAKNKQETETLAMEVEAIKNAIGQMNSSERRQVQRKNY